MNGVAKKDPKAGHHEHVMEGRSMIAILQPDSLLQQRFNQTERPIMKTAHVRSSTEIGKAFHASRAEEMKGIGK